MRKKSDSELPVKNYKKNTIKKLREEMVQRNIGYMSNWTKQVLIKRLEEEDRKGKYQPNAQLEQFEVLFKGFDTEYADLEIKFKSLGEKQKEILELNNVYAKEKHILKERMINIKANKEFLTSQRQTILDDLDPSW